MRTMRAASEGLLHEFYTDGTPTWRREHTGRVRGTLAMLQKCVKVAAACALCVGLIDLLLRPASAGENAATPLMAVPVPVLATRRPASEPPPQRADPIANLAGNWSGQGTMVPTSGRSEQFRCIITYEVGRTAARVRQHLRCQGDNRNFDAVTHLVIVHGRVTGVWADNAYSISGTLSGNVTEKGFTIQLRSAFFDAKMSVVASDCQQIIKVVPDDQSGFMKTLAATVKKC
jgi:hypothetical protein